MKPDEQNNIFTDEIDYTKTPGSSVWGAEDDSTKKILTHSGMHGKLLNLCAGDGRFNQLLLEQADLVIAADIDNEALQKLQRITPDELKKKLIPQIVDVSKKLPFKDKEFDGIFCVGTLHLFPKPIFKQIFEEIDRVLKPGGRIIIDFATDIHRTYADGSLWIVDNEPNYSMSEALNFLQEIFRHYEADFITDSVAPEKVDLGDKKYIFTSNLILIDAKKP